MSCEKYIVRDDYEFVNKKESDRRRGTCKVCRGIELRRIYRRRKNLKYLITEVDKGVLVDAAEKKNYDDLIKDLNKLLKQNKIRKIKLQNTIKELKEMKKKEENTTE